MVRRYSSRATGATAASDEESSALPKGNDDASSVGQRINALRGKHALITSATGVLGSHVARTLSGAGATVIVADLKTESLRPLTQEISSGGQTALTVEMDVTRSASIKAVLRAVWPVDIFVNNMADVDAPSSSVNPNNQDWDFDFDPRIRAASLVATEVAQAMKAAKIGGTIINIGGSPLAARDSTPYAVTRAYVAQLTMQLALRFAPYAIRVNAILPGYFSSEVITGSGAKAIRRSLAGRIPRGRLGELRDIEGLLLLLASDASQYMTGAIIPVDGGILAARS